MKWIPAHWDNSGNEHADVLAKKAAPVIQKRTRISTFNFETQLTTRSSTPYRETTILLVLLAWLVREGVASLGKDQRNHIKIMFDASSFADPTPLAHSDASRDVFPRGGTSELGLLGRVETKQNMFCKAKR
ncbi:hypothetical protein TNCV_2667591 [Trichonephila clavipes]|nr:hypothetical protein TNCV_2667591 [Trichonephila clavipes]